MHIVAQTPSPEPAPVGPRLGDADETIPILRTITESTGVSSQFQLAGSYSSFFLGDPFTGGTQLAIDSEGGFHVASRDLIGDYAGDTVYYGYCALECDDPTNWNIIDIYTSNTPLAKTINVRLELDPSDRPRVAWIEDDPQNDSYVIYVECNLDCLNTDNWDGSFIAGDGGGFAFHTNNDSSRWFTLDNQGRPRFAYIYDEPLSQGEIRYGYCDTNCANANNWFVVTIAITDEWDPAYSLDFTDDNHPRMAVVAEGQLYYFACDVSCGVSANWQFTNIHEQLDDSIQLTLDAQNRPRVARYFNHNTVMYDGCNSDCMNPNNWDRQALTAFPEYAGIGIDLMFDGQNQPHMAFVGNGDFSQAETGYALCLSACDNPAASVWTYQVVERDDNIPEISLINTCNAQVWDMDGPVSLVLDTQGEVVFGYAAANYQYDTTRPTWNCVYELETTGPECTGNFPSPLCFLPVASQYPRVRIPVVLDEINFLPMIVR